MSAYSCKRPCLRNKRPRQKTPCARNLSKLMRGNTCSFGLSHLHLHSDSLAWKWKMALVEDHFPLCFHVSQIVVARSSPIQVINKVIFHDTHTHTLFFTYAHCCGHTGSPGLQLLLHHLCECRARHEARLHRWRVAAVSCWDSWCFLCLRAKVRHSHSTKIHPVRFKQNSPVILVGSFSWGSNKMFTQLTVSIVQSCPIYLGKFVKNMSSPGYIWWRSCQQTSTKACMLSTAPDTSRHEWRGS